MRLKGKWVHCQYRKKCKISGQNKMKSDANWQGQSE